MSSGLIEALNWVAAVEKDKESKKVTMAFLPIFGFFNFFDDLLQNWKRVKKKNSSLKSELSGGRDNPRVVIRSFVE